MTRLHPVLAILRNPTQRKHLVRWILSQRHNYLIRKAQPWIVFDAIRHLDSLPLEGKRVFEYGSGGSTLYWLSRHMSGVSVEHDPIWFESLRPHLGDSPAIEYSLVEPHSCIPTTEPDVADPDRYLSNNPRFRNYDFQRYASSIDRFPNAHFDVVLIDGRARPACLKHAAKKVKPKGLLILDNADRAYYTTKSSHLLGDYLCLRFYGAGPMNCDMWGTNFYVREE